MNTCSLRFMLPMLAISPVLSFSLLGQLPDHVPTDGLVGWYALDGNVDDASPLSNHGSAFGPTAVSNRFGESASSLNFNGIQDYLSIPHSATWEEMPELTISMWVRPDAHPTSIETCGGVTGQRAALMNKWATSNESRTFELMLQSVTSGPNQSPGHLNVCHNAGCYADVGSWGDYPVAVWTHLCVVYGVDSGFVCVNGSVVYSSAALSVSAGMNWEDNEIYIGDFPNAGCNRAFDGQLDDIGAWSRALTLSEIETLYAWTPAQGCMDSEACNYDSEALIDDGSCHFNCQFCLNGTIWDEAAGGCIGNGSGDINNDGCVQLGDLLDLLGDYGSCESDETAWQCGEALEYQGYDYSTVQIGEQCWFAENLRTESYSNGSSISSVIGQPDDAVMWLDLSSDQEGALNVHPEYEEEGMVYNWFSTVDERGLCPSGWHVPSTSDYEQLTLFVEAEYQNDFVFALVDESQNLGTNESGYGATITAYVDGQTGIINAPEGENQYMWYWTSTPGPFPDSFTWRVLTNFGDPYAVGTGNHLKSRGLSVRCIRDSE